MRRTIDGHIDSALEYYIEDIERKLDCPAMGYVGPIFNEALSDFIDTVERIADPASRAKFANPRRIALIVTTPGGSAEIVEKMVDIVRAHFDEIHYYVPDYAMSAGTIFAMAADKIFMDYTSSLGPIDPQVQNAEGKWVAALGYLDKINEIITRANAGAPISPVDVVLLQSVDLGTLRAYEQARDLSVALLKKWLVAYKFKDWATHSTTNPGAPVTQDEKIERARQIADLLSDNKHWHSHGRMIGTHTLQSVLKLKIDDFGVDAEFQRTIRQYNDLLVEFCEKVRKRYIIHARDN